MPDEVTVRPIARDAHEIDLVAERMRLTLMEVLGPDAGASMYSIDWLRDRVHFHLDPDRCTGEVFVAEIDCALVAHTIVRLERGEEGEPIGLFSTTYVDPAARRAGVADALVLRGEAWLASRGMTTFVTDTSETNEKLIALFEKHGYAIVFRAPEKRMIRLAKTRHDQSRLDSPQPG